MKQIITAVGIISGLIMIYNVAQRRRKDIPVFIRKALAHNYNARTIPPFGIYVKESEKDNQALIDHEKIHWKQYKKMGLINFYSDYSKELKQYGYDKMPMEKEARKNETEYCKENYTDCVRTGQAQTVFNPKFRT